MAEDLEDVSVPGCTCCREWVFREGIQVLTVLWTKVNHLAACMEGGVHLKDSDIYIRRSDSLEAMDSVQSGAPLGYWGTREEYVSNSAL